MAMTHDYMDYLNDKVGISPANSQEELQAAQTIAGLMGQHDVEPSVEEFDASVLAGTIPAILSVAMFLGVLVAGFGMVPLTVVGLILALVPAVIAGLRLIGRDVPLSFGPSGRSQNVVAVHRATGPLVTKGNRTIVVVAHYDSPHENFLYSSPVAPYLPLVTKVARFCVFAVALCALLQLFVFIPEVGRKTVWVIGILASLPSLLLAVASIAERLAPCTLGANDNKASVAALLGVLENVRPSGLAPRERVAAVVEPAADEAPSLDGLEGAPEDELRASEVAEPEPSEPVEASEPTVVSAPVVEVVGVRRGEEVLRALGMLPEDCEIVYAIPDAAVPAAGEPVSASSTAVLSDVPAPVAPAESHEAAAGEKAPASKGSAATRDQLLSTGQFSIVMDDGARGVGPKDSSGLTNMDGALDLDATQPAPPVRPDAPADPEWGKSEFRPTLSNVARRASLFDLPDPSAAGVDPFGTDPHAVHVTAPHPGEDEPVASEPVAASAPEPVSTISSGVASVGKLGNRVLGFFDRFKKSPADAPAPGDSQPWLGADDEREDGDGPRGWRGGAATRNGLRLVGDDEAAPTEEELREAVLSLGDDALVSHDIWFVALGASSLDHAGMKAFLAAHRSEVRGCFVVNLDCVGAGDLTVLTHEGLENARRADRRLTRLLSDAATDLHVSLEKKRYDWASTDASPAMRASTRSVTLMGMGANGLPALTRTPDDVAGNVDGDQAAHVAEIVTEMIRRS